MPMLLLGIAPAHGEVTIELTDGDDALLQNLRARLALRSEPCDAPAWRVRRYFDRAEKDMRPALHALGYYQATIDKQLDREEDCWQANFVVDPGPRVTRQTPGRPVSLPSASAMIAAPPS